MPGSKRYLQQLWWCSTSWVQGWDWLSRSQHRWAVDLTYSAHPVFVFPNHFLFCFYFLALSSFYKLHWLPLSTIEPVVFLLQSKSKLYMIPFIYSWNSLASEEGGRLLFPRANRGPADQERFNLPWNSHCYFTHMCLYQFSFTKYFHLLAPVESSTACPWYSHNQGGHTSWFAWEQFLVTPAVPA